MAPEVRWTDPSAGQPLRERHHDAVTETAEERARDLRQPSESRRRVRHAPHGGLPARLVGGQCGRQVITAPQLVKQHCRVHQRAVGALPEVRRHRVRRVAQQDQPSVGPAAAADRPDAVHDQILPSPHGVENRRRGWIDERPGRAEGRQIRVIRGATAQRRACRRIDVGAVRHGKAAEQAGLGPGLHARGQLRADHGAHVVDAGAANPCGEAASPPHLRVKAVGAHDQVRVKSGVPAARASDDIAVGSDVHHLGAEAALHQRLGLEGVQEEGLERAAAHHPHHRVRSGRRKQHASLRVDDADAGEGDGDRGHGGPEAQGFQYCEPVLRDGDARAHGLRVRHLLEHRDAGAGPGQQ
jgi:hypothetical protein